MQLNKIFLLSLVLLSNTFAADFQPAGTVEHTLKQPTTVQFAPSKKIKLLNFKLSDKAVEALKRKAHLIHNSPVLKTTQKIPSEIQLGMNGVPVLDQGNYGTCVTFAVTAALDAALGKGDYISQLCLLQLGNYVTQQAYGYSGWDGSLNRTALSRLEDHGFISKETQRAIGCGELNEYPQNESPIPSTAISFDDYHKISEQLTDSGIYSSPILDPYATMLNSEINSKKVIEEIKKALNRGQRVTMTVLLPAVDLGVAGAVGKYYAENDTWVLSTIIERELYLNSSLFFPGHAMVITGYDDTATAIDDLGREHTGLFTLRNSWGEQRGNKGDFYMSYDYFQVLGFEANQISLDDFDEAEDEDIEENKE